MTTSGVLILWIAIAAVGAGLPWLSWWTLNEGPPHPDDASGNSAQDEIPIEHNAELVLSVVGVGNPAMFDHIYELIFDSVTDAGHVATASFDRQKMIAEFSITEVAPPVCDVCDGAGTVRAYTADEIGLFLLKGMNRNDVGTEIPCPDHRGGGKV